MLLAIFGAILLFIGVPITIIITIVSSIKEKKISMVVLSIPIAFVVGLFLIVAGAVISDASKNLEGSDKTIVENTETETENPLEFKNDGMTIKYLEHKISGNNLYVYFEMTNESNENATFDYKYSVKTFQDGIELEKNYIYDCEEEKNSSKEIKHGASIVVAEVFELRNTESNAEVEVTDWISFSDEKLLEFEIKLN